MPPIASSLRPFLGTSDRAQSLKFYQEIGFKETWKSDNISLLALAGGFSFYLQDYYVKDWVDNSMVFLEVSNLMAYHTEISQVLAEGDYGQARLTPLKNEAWGQVFYLHDPQGILWHVGQFSSPK